jgi:hypothetical protein
MKSKMDINFDIQGFIGEGRVGKRGSFPIPSCSTSIHL